MIKLGKTKYHTKWGDLTVNQIIAKLQKQGLTVSIQPLFRWSKI
jgi:hypothetical protein